MMRHPMRHPRNFHPFAFIILALLAFSLATMWLWNAILPSLFTGVSEISFFQAMGLLILSRLLFSGMGGRMKDFGHFERRSMYDKWKQMPEEERDQLMKKTRNRFYKIPEDDSSEH